MHDLIPLKVTHGIHTSSYRMPNKVAVWYGDRSVSYKQLVDRMRLVSGAAIADPAFGSTVTMIGQNSVEFLEILLGLADIGISVCTISSKSTLREISSLLVESKTSVLFVDEKLYKEEYKQFATKVITIGEEYERWLANSKPIIDYPFVDDRSIFNIICSSGTTGDPKGVMISHRSRVMSFYTMAMDYGCLNINDTTLCVAPLSNGGGNGLAMATLNNGGTIVLSTSIHPDHLLRLIERHKITCAFLIPAFIQVLVNTRCQFDITSLRTIVCSAAPLSADLKLRSLEYFGDIVWDVYGSAECGPTTMLPPSLVRQYPSSVGYCVSGATIKIQNNGVDCQPHEVGEIMIETLTAFSGYMGRGKPDKFVSVGDLGYVDENNFLYMVGRKNDMIITGGNNVYPEEVESILNRCPGIIESAVFGYKDESRGEIVSAHIVGAPTVDPIEYCKQYLASYKVPRKLAYVDELPKSSFGKILRRNLRN